jgi:hypothetical protein
VYAQAGTTLLCIELATGNLVRSIELPGGVSSSLMGHGQRIFREASAKGSGALVLVDASPDRFRRLGGAFNIAGANSVTPTVIDGRMFVRTLDSMHCYDLRVPAADVVKSRTTQVRRALTSRDPLLAKAAIGALGTVGRTGIDALVSILETGPPPNRSAATEALLQLGAQGKNALAAGLVRIIGADPKRGRDAFAILSRIAPSLEPTAARPVMDAAVRVLDGRDNGLKIAAIGTLGAFGPAALHTMPRLEKAFLEEPLREATIAAAEKIRPDKPIRVRIEVEADDTTDDIGLDLLD